MDPLSIWKLIVKINKSYFWNMWSSDCCVEPLEMFRFSWNFSYLFTYHSGMPWNTGRKKLCKLFQNSHFHMHPNANLPVYITARWNQPWTYSKLAVTQKWKHTPSVSREMQPNKRFFEDLNHLQWKVRSLPSKKHRQRNAGSMLLRQMSTSKNIQIAKPNVDKKL